MLLYGVINFQARNALGLSNNEFIYLFAVRYFERDRDGGFCSVWASEMSEIVNVEQRNIARLKNRLQEKGLLIIRGDGAVRVTDAFRDICNAAQQNVSDFFAGKQPSEGDSPPRQNVIPPAKRHTPPRQNVIPPPDEKTPPPRQNVIPVNVCNNEDSKSILLNRVSTAHTTEKNQIFKKQENGEGENVTSLVCLFRECNYFKGGAAGRAAFEADLKAAGCPDSTDFEYYFNRILSWSDDKAAKSANWGVKAAQFVIGDRQNGKMITKAATHEAAAPKYKIKETRF
jgi:DNA-binding MarR family transcriptional regulator